MWWKLVNRNKRTIALDLKSPDDVEVVRRLVVDADVLIENFRPGTLERLGLGPDVLLELNPSLVITRVTGFGQTGPYRNRPGFATIAESMSGLAAISGEPGGQPLLPPIALTDEVTGIVAAFATMVALHSGVGQVVDVSLLESLFQLMGPLISLYELTGQMQERLGSGSAVLGAARHVSVQRRPVDRRVDVERHGRRPGAEPARSRRRPAVHVRSRLAWRIDEALEAVMTEWCAARTQAEVMDAFTAAEAAIGPVMSMADISVDPHYAAREAIADGRRHPDAGADRPAQRDAGRPPVAGTRPRRRR